MSSYRTGNHWGVTIVRQGKRLNTTDDCAFCCASNAGCLIHPPVEDQLVAVVVNGDQALAEQICALLNDAHTPDVDHTRGAAEALAVVADRIADLDGTEITMRALRQVLEAAAAEIGVEA